MGIRTVFASSILLAAWSAYTPAFAATTVTASPGTAHPSQVVTLTLAGFGDSEAIDIYLDTVDTLLWVSSATGTYTGSLTLPASAQPGKHYVTAIGRHSGDAAQAAVTVSSAWTEFGYGAAHLGWNPYENVLGTGNVGSIGQLWAVAIGSNAVNYSPSPVVVGGYVYVVGSSGGIQELNRTTGALVWRAETADVFYAAPAVIGGVLYAGGSTTSNVYALTASSGAVKWTRTLGGQPTSSPVVVNSVVYLGAADGKLYALSASTGAVLWTFATGNVVYTSPTVVNGIVYVASYTTLYAVNAVSGGEIWDFAANDSIYGTPAVANGRIFFGTIAGKFYALAAGMYGGASIWSATTGGTVNAAAVANGTVYVGDANANVYAFDTHSGSENWSFTADSGINTSITVANGIVYAGDINGTLYALDAGYGGLLASARAGRALNSEAAISDGVIYVNSSDGYIYAYAPQAGSGQVARAGIARPVPASLRPELNLPVTH